MHLQFSTRYKKKYKKLPTEMKRHVNERLDLFVSEPFHPLLNNHPLHGKWEGHCGINITGDFRAIYEPSGNSVAFFADIGTHSELYGK